MVRVSILPKNTTQYPPARARTLGAIRSKAYQQWRPPKTPLVWGQSAIDMKSMTFLHHRKMVAGREKSNS